MMTTPPESDRKVFGVYVHRRSHHPLKIVGQKRQKKATGVWLVAGGTSQKERWDIAKGDILQEKSSSSSGEINYGADECKETYSVKYV